LGSVRVADSEKKKKKKKKKKAVARAGEKAVKKVKPSVDESEVSSAARSEK
jgi:hypothetical protein